MNAQQVGAGLGILCVSLFVGLLIGGLIGAIILRAACWLFNKFSGQSSDSGGVPQPSYGHALAIVFITLIVNSIVGFVIGFLISIALGVGQPGHVDPRTGQIIAQLVTLPVGIFIGAAIIAAMLPTTFVRGLLISILQVFIALCVLMVIGGIILVIVFVFVGIGAAQR